MARDAFHAVKSMSILCLWDIQLTFDRNGVGTYGAYHHKSELKRCNRVQFFFFNPPIFTVVIAILEPANSTRTDNSAKGIVAKTQEPPLNPSVFKGNICIYKLIYRQTVIKTGN